MQIAIDAMSGDYALLPNVEGIKEVFARMSSDRTIKLVSNQEMLDNNVGNQTTLLSGRYFIPNNQKINSFLLKDSRSCDRSDNQNAYPLLSKSGIKNITNVSLMA